MSPRTSTAFEKIRGESRKKILMTALELFATHGYQGTSISRIAKACGISKGLMYNYFESKEDLFKGIIKSFEEEAESMFTPNLEAEPKVALKEIIELTFKLLIHYKSMNRLLMATTLQAHEHLSFIHDMGLEKMKYYNALLSKMLGELGYANPEMEAHTITAILDGICLQHTFLDEDYPLERMRMYLLEKYCS